MDFDFSLNDLKQGAYDLFKFEKDIVTHKSDIRKLKGDDDYSQVAVSTPPPVKSSANLIPKTYIYMGLGIGAIALLAIVLRKK